MVSQQELDEFYRSIIEDKNPKMKLFLTILKQPFLKKARRRIAFGIKETKIRDKMIFNGQKVFFIHDTSCWANTWKSYIAFTDKGVISYQLNLVRFVEWKDIEGIEINIINRYEIFSEENSCLISQEAPGIPEKYYDDCNVFFEKLVYIAKNYSNW